MRRVVLLLVLGALAAGAALSPLRPATAQDGAARIASIVFDTVDEWQRGNSEGLLISNNDGGELRLAAGGRQGTYTSGFTRVDWPVNAVGAVWKAEVPQGTSLQLEVRGGPTQDNPGPWQALVADDARSQSDEEARALRSVRPVTGDTVYVQFRATFASEVENASPVLSEMRLSAIDAVSGPNNAAALTAQVTAPYGPSVLTPAPRIVPREAWDPNRPVVMVSRQAPRAIVLHQIGSDAVGDDPLPFLRANAAYHIVELGWDDTPFHFIVGRDGTIYEGHIGGPTALVPRLAAGDTAVHVALIGSGTPSQQAQATTASLLAWLGQAYGIPLRGQHTVAAPGSSPAPRPNVATHTEIVPEAAGHAPELQATLPIIRQAADQATVQARWYFAEGNPRDYGERLSVYNPTTGPASVRFTILRDPGGEVIRTVSVPAGGRTDLLVSGIFSDTTDAPAIVESNQAVIAERFMDTGRDITASIGVSRPARVWYFAEGSTEGNNRTFLVLFNPQREPASAAITYMRADGTTAEQRTVVPARKRTVVAVHDQQPGLAFGARVIANLPIVAERTMRFGEGDAQGGAHTSPGVVQLSRSWYFAEGTTEPPFQMRVLVLNPNTQPVTSTVTFLTADGTSLARKYAIPPTSRLAINVNDVVPALGVATRVEADRPVSAERALYWRDGSVGTIAAGTPAPSFTWRFADGRTSGDFQQYLLFNNPDPNHQARVTVDFVKSDGSTASQQVVMPGGSRYTMAVHQLLPGESALAATVRSTLPIIVERSIFPGAPASDSNRGGATTLGLPEVRP